MIANGNCLLKASVCYFYQNFNIHTIRCDFLYIHDEQVHWLMSYTQITDTHDNISKGEKGYSEPMDFQSL